MIVIDVETTGETPHLHSLLSIGAVDFSKPNRQFYSECRIRKGAKVDPIALKINGFSMNSIHNSAMSQKTMLKEFLGWAGKTTDTTLAGMNHYMDVYFIEHALKHNRMKNPFKYRLFDIHTLAYANHIKRAVKVPIDKISSSMKLPVQYKASGLNSGVIANYCGLPKEYYPHNALTGAKLEAEEISRLLYGKNLLPEYKEYRIPNYLKNGYR